MTILDEINAVKYKEVSERKQIKPIESLTKSPFYNRNPLSFKTFITNSEKTGIIAEFKRKSPSKGTINDKADVKSVTRAYSSSGASALSVLTDTKYFGGFNDDLIVAREYNNIPILRKDFIVDTYQLHEAKAIGADVVLLIAASLSVEKTKNLAREAQSLGLEVLLEIHNETELAHINNFVDVVGVNNRNLKTFTVDINTSLELFDKIPNEIVKISESGISNIENIKTLKNKGFDGFLIGENFMKTASPGESFKQFVADIEKSI